MAASRRRSETNHHPRLDPQLEHESDQDDYEEEEEEPKTADEEEQVLYSDTELDQDTSPDEIGPENPDLTNRLLTDTSDDSGTAVRLNGQSTNDANLREEDKSDNSRDDHDEKEHVIELTSNTDVKRVIENELKRFDSTAIHLTSNHNSAFTLTINRVWITAIACLVCFI